MNADDFGRHALINAAVERAVMSGCLRSATLMPGGQAFADAVAIGRRHPELGVGIHFTLVNGNPLLPSKEIPSLVGPDGLFLADYTLLVKRFLRGGVCMEDVQCELGAQLVKMQQTGLQLTHVDSHQHMHTLPGVIDIVLRLAASGGIRAVRIPKTSICSGSAGGLVQWVGRMGLFSLAKLAEYKARHQGFRMPEHFAGIVAGEAVGEAYFKDLLLHLTPGTTEVMLHPGLDNRILQAFCRWPHDFEEELRAVTSSDVLRCLQQRGIVFANFRALTSDNRQGSV